VRSDQHSFTEGDSNRATEPKGNRLMKHHPFLQQHLIARSNLTSVVAPVRWKSGTNRIAIIPVPVDTSAGKSHSLGSRPRHIIKLYPRPHDGVHVLERGEAPFRQPLRLIRRRTDG